MHNKFSILNANEFEKVIADGQTILLDARSNKEFATEHIRNAINIDVSNPNFPIEAEARLPKSKLIAVYCKSGVRSQMAATLLANRGFNTVFLHGGISEWIKAGKETAY